MTHIIMYAKLMKRKFEGLSITPEIFEDMTGVPITPEYLEWSLDLKPQQNQLVQALLSLGMSVTEIADALRLTKATVSIHKNNPVKSDYRNHFMEHPSNREYSVDVTQINVQRRAYRKKSKLDPDYRPRNRRSKEELEQEHDRNARIKRLIYERTGEL